MSHRKFTDEQIATIRALAANGRSLYRIAQDEGVARVVIENIVKGRTYAASSAEQRNPPRRQPLPKATRRIEEWRMVREFKLPPLPRPAPLIDPNFGRSYPFPKKAP